MRRKQQPRERTERVADLKQNLSQEQLAAIGAVTIAWNELEIFIHLLLGYGLYFPWPLLLEVTTRINGIDGQIEIIRKLRTLHMDIGVEEKVWKLIEISLSGITEYKRFRDGVIHARVLDAPQGIGEIIQKRGAREEILLTEKALNALYDRLVLLRSELVSITLIFEKVSRHLQIDILRDKRPNTKSLSQDIQAYVSQLQQHQSQRLLLQPLPGFPEIPLASL